MVKDSTNVCKLVMKLVDKFPKLAKVGRREAPARRPRPKWGGHEWEPEHLGWQRCSRCWATCRPKGKRWAGKCAGQPGLPARVHPSHCCSLFAAGQDPLIICTKCALYSSFRVLKLAEPCNHQPLQSSYHRKRRLALVAQGLHPGPVPKGGGPRMQLTSAVGLFAKGQREASCSSSSRRTCCMDSPQASCQGSVPPGTPQPDELVLPPRNGRKLRRARARAIMVSLAGRRRRHTHTYGAPGRVLGAALNMGHTSMVSGDVTHTYGAPGRVLGAALNMGPAAMVVSDDVCIGSTRPLHSVYSDNVCIGLHRICQSTAYRPGP